MSVGIANEFECGDWPESADAQRYSSSFWPRKDGSGRGFGSSYLGINPGPRNWPGFRLES